MLVFDKPSIYKSFSAVYYSHLIVAGGAKILLDKDNSLAGQKMGFVKAGFLAFTTPIACLFAVIFLQFFNPAESK